MKSQVRQHLRFTIFVAIRVFFERLRIGLMGKHVYIDSNVKLMRYPQNIKIDDDVVIKEGVRICACNKEATIQIGKRTTIGYHTFIFSSANVKIGDDCLLAPFVYIVDSNHGINKNELINLQKNEVNPIVIENDVWIASNVTILKGVTIGEGSVIAANSVVNQNIPPYEVWGGTPAKKIKNRD